MKKLVFLFLFLPLFAAAQSIPNGNFESWFWVGGWFENPEFWVTDNNQLQNTVTKDYDSYEGETAMRVTAQPANFLTGEYGEATTVFDINYIPSSLNFYAKYSIEAGSVTVEISFFNANEDIIYTAYWQSEQIIDDYTLVSIPLTPFVTPEDPPPTHARVRVITLVGDFDGHAWISLDAMEFGTPLSVKKTELNSFKIYPNPATENITIQSTEGSLGNLKITDTLGKTLIEKQVQENQTTINIQNLAAGIYMISSDKGNLKATRFIVK